MLENYKPTKTEVFWRRTKIFAKAQISAFVGGVVDYGIMILCTELFHVYYVFSIGISGVIGAIINFTLNKKWTFHSKDRLYKNTVNTQLFRFVVVVAGSIFMKSSGTYCVTTYIGIDYKISRLIVDLIVSVLFNFNMQKYWVFIKKAEPV